MTVTNDLRDDTIDKAADLIEAINDLDDHIREHPTNDADVQDQREKAINHAKDRADRAQRGLEHDWPNE